MIVGWDGLDIIEMLDPSTLARVERIRPEDREADNSRAYCNRLVWPIKAVGELRLEKYEAVKWKKMPLFEFKKWIDSFNQNRRKRELDWDIVYSKCYRENGWN